MKLQLKRHFLGSTYTIGRLYIDGKYFCDTLEDKYRDLSKEDKVYGETAIPYGTYKVIVNHSPKFKKMLPRLLDVPHSKGILIHGGRNDKDTLGCILVGYNRIKGGLVGGLERSSALTKLLLEAQNNNEEILITIKNDD